MVTCELSRMSGSISSGLVLQYECSGAIARIGAGTYLRKRNGSKDIPPSITPISRQSDSMVRRLKNEIRHATELKVATLWRRLRDSYEGG